MEEIKTKTNDFVCSGASTTAPVICGSTVQNCSAYYSLLPSIEFVLDSIHYGLSPQSYTVSLSSVTGMDVTGCELMLTSYGDSTNIILGAPFMQQFVTTFDYDKNTVSFGTNANAAAGVYCKKSLTSLDIFLIIAGIVVGGLILAIMYLKFCKKH